MTAFRFGEVHQFGQPITITVHYRDMDVIGLKRETLRLWYRNSEGEPWAMLGEPVRVMSGTLGMPNRATMRQSIAEVTPGVVTPVPID